MNIWKITVKLLRKTMELLITLLIIILPLKITELLSKLILPSFTWPEWMIIHYMLLILLIFLIYGEYLTKRIKQEERLQKIKTCNNNEHN